MLTFTLPFPPSVNGYWRVFRSRSILSKRGREYRIEAKAAALGSEEWSMEPVSGRVSVTMELYPPDRRKRDIDNYCKGPLDALTHAGVWEDDEQIDELHVYKREADPKDPRIEITITPE